MSRLVYIIFIMFVMGDLVAIKKLEQSGAVVIICDPAYFINCKAITRRVRRHGSYMTNATATTLHPLDNNVTIIISLGLETYGEMFAIKTKICEVLRVKWLSDYIRKYSNIPMTCPVLPGDYKLVNMEFTPKDFPIPIPNGQLKLRLIMELTDTKHIISQFEIKISS